MHRMAGSWLGVCLVLVSCAKGSSELGAARRASPAAALSLLPRQGERAAAPPAQPVSRRALLIGINDYSASQLPPAPVASAARRRYVPRLEGAVNDVLDMREMLLARYGFAPADVLVLTDQAATRDAVLRAIEQHLIAPAGEGDVLFFYWSGHGSLVFNPLSSKPDKMDETIVPADAVRGTPDIHDKELRALFNRVLDRHARLTVMLDSCHSASAIRGLLDDSHVRSVEPDPHPVRDGSLYGPRPEDRGALVLAAAQSFDNAYEAVDERGRHHGAFSLAWMRALRDAVNGEPVEETFFRARARLQAERRFQDPVLEGAARSRRAPFLGQPAGPDAGRMIVAVERLEGDGTVVLQGGRANGLTEGSELRLLEPGQDVRIVVTELDGFGRCKGRVSGPLPAALRSGALAEVVRWAAPPDHPLRVWMSAVTDPGPPARLAQELTRQAPRQGVRWVEDPTRQLPTHVLRWHAEGWELLTRGSARERLGPAPDAASVLARMRGQGERALFVQLPAPMDLVQAMKVGPGTPHSGIEAAERPDDADYVLTGRLAAGGLEYAWLRPGVAASDQPRTSLPVRSAWESLADEHVGRALEDALLLLRKIQGWLHLETPPGAASPYELVVRRGASGGEAVGDRILAGRQFYNLALRHKQGFALPRVQPRFYYVFVLDSDGCSHLLFPNPTTPDQNRFPASPGAPAEIPLGPDGAFRVDPPYGADTYFLLGSDESIPNPRVLDWEGFRARGPLGATPLEELLSLTGGWTRSATPALTPAGWSVERELFVSVPPSRSGDGGK